MIDLRSARIALLASLALAHLPCGIARAAESSAPPAARGYEARTYIERSVNLIQEGHYDLARTYLAPTLIDHRLNPLERSRAYYLHGYSLYAQQRYVSARKDYVRALEFNPGNAAAQVALGGLYYRGEGVDPDPRLAFGFFEQAAAQDHPEALLYMGYAYLEGRGVEQDLAQARSRLQKAADNGSSEAMIFLGRSYREPVTDSPDPALAQSWYQRAYEAGEVDGLVAQAFMYRDGELGSADIDRAFELFSQAAGEGSSAAKLSLGHMYLVGEGTVPDPGRARELFEAAIAQGNYGGAVNLGHMFEVGLGVEKNPDTALHWYEMGAAADNPQAQLRAFYLLLRRGEAEAAANWLARAARHDLPQAHNDYAWLLSTSRQDHMRDGQRALTYAQLAVNRQSSPAYLDTLAAAYAELGRFPEAIATQQRAIGLITDQTSEEARALAEHLAAYQAQQPWRE
ncbi:MAG: tetratricopeptide repeat protein [Pseudomonadales bacterium]